MKQRIKHLLNRQKIKYLFDSLIVPAFVAGWLFTGTEGLENVAKAIISLMLIVNIFFFGSVIIAADTMREMYKDSGVLKKERDFSNSMRPYRIGINLLIIGLLVWFGEFVFAAMYLIAVRSATVAADMMFEVVVDND